jgi:hypothetical protein
MFWLLFLFFVLAMTMGVVGKTGPQGGLGISPEIASFTATPRIVVPGENVTLTWKTRGAVSVTIEWGPEDHPRGTLQQRTGLPGSGTLVMQPRENTVYVLSCETATGVMCMSASTTVSTSPDTGAAKR